MKTTKKYQNTYSLGNTLVLLVVLIANLLNCTQLNCTREAGTPD